MWGRAGAIALAAVTVASTVAGAAVAAPAPAPVSAELLEAQGCFIGRTADRGDRLTAAVIRFQAANRLKQTGGLDDRTRERLKDGARRCDVRPVPKHSGEGRRIVLSQRQNWLWLVRDDGSVRAQGGIVDNDWLPQKTYVTGDQCGRPGRSRHRSTEDGALRIDFFIRFAYCRVGFHEIPVSTRTGRKIHADYLVGTDLQKSHGCLRMAHPLIDALWAFSKTPTKVVVVRG